MHISVIGAGHVGLVQAIGLVELGHHVTLTDTEQDKVEILQLGRSPMFESDIEKYLRSGLDSGRLNIQVADPTLVASTELVFVCVATPQREDGSTNLDAVIGVLSGIKPHLVEGTVVVLKSTVPPLTSDKLAPMLPAGVHLAANPEFLAEGSAVADFLRPSRIVIGHDSPEVLARLRRAYDGIDAPILEMDAVSAELAKYGANAYLASRVTFTNAMADLSDAFEANVEDVLRGIGSDPRIGNSFMRPGPGFGGSCFEKDIRSLVSVADEYDCDTDILSSVLSSNENHMGLIVDRILAWLPDPRASRVAVWGLAYKAGTDDVRCSPSLAIATELAEKGVSVVCHDPVVRDHWDPIFADPIEAVRNADALFVGTEWPEYKTVDLAAVKAAMRGTHVLDGRNILDVDRAKAAGLRYSGIGRR